jgi:putative ABC transport system substrate-binding protein
MRRRDFVAGIGSAAVWPLAARAQQPDRGQRVGVLMAPDETDPQGKARFSAFTQRLAELGWTEGRNLRMDVRWAADNVDRMRLFAKELVGLKPDVILATSTPVTVLSRGRHGQFQSFSRISTTRSPPASLRACRGPAGISPA